MKSFKWYLIGSLFIALLSISYYFYLSKSFKTIAPFLAVPSQNCEAIIQIKGLNHLNQVLNDSLANQNLKKDLFNTIAESNNYKNLIISLTNQSDTSILSALINRQFLISIHNKNANSKKILLLTIPLKNRIEKKEITNFFEKLTFTKELSYKNQNKSLLQTASSNKPINFAFFEGLLLISSNSDLITQSLDQLNNKTDNLSSDQTFIKAVSVSQNLNFDNLFIPIGRGSKDDHSILPLIDINSQGWAEFDIDYNNNALSLNGIILLNSKNKSNYPPKSNNFASIIPDNSISATIYNLNDYQKPNASNDSDFSSQNNPLVYEEINEINKLFEGPICFVDFEQPEDKLVIVQLNKQSEFTEKINSLYELIKPNPSRTEEYKVDEKLSIKLLSSLPKWVENAILDQKITKFNTSYYLIDNNYWFLSTNKELLIESYLKIIRGNVIANNKAYRSLKKNFSSKENCFKYNLNQPLNNLNQSKYLYDFGAQIEYKDSTILTSIVIKEPLLNNINNNIVWKCYLDSTLIKVSDPLYDKNLKQSGILIQDAKYNLYFINNIGRILWKRAIDEPITNNIITYSFKDKTSFIFTTPKKLYQIDLSGNFVGNYPILLSDKATAEISLFDYENNGDFRIFIPTENQKILVFDNRGNIVVGFNPENFDTQILSPIQHFVLDKKDYLTVSDQFVTKILDRKGGERVKITEPFTKNSRSKFYAIKDKKESFLVTSDTMGNIIKIKIPSGETTIKKALNSNKHHHFHVVKNRNNSEIYLFITDNEILGFSRSGDIINRINCAQNIQSAQSFIDQNENYLTIFNPKNNRVQIVNLNGSKIEEIWSDEAYSALNAFQNEKTLSIITGSSENAVINYNFKYDYAKN